MVIETATETKPGLIRPFLGNKPSYYEDIGDLDLQQAMRDSGMELDARNLYKGLSRNRLTNGTFYSSMVGLTLPEFTLLLKELQNRFIVPPPELPYQSARTRGTNYFDRIAIDATFALAFYCRQDQEFMGILRMPGREGELPWQKVLDKTKTGLGESILAIYLLDPSQPPQIKPTFQIESNKPTPPNLDERERDPTVPLLEFEPEDYQIYAPAILSPEQGLCDQAPFERATEIISQAWGVNAEKIKLFLAEGGMSPKSIGKEAAAELLAYLDNFPYWRKYFKAEAGKGVYDVYGRLKKITKDQIEAMERYRNKPGESKNLDLDEDEEYKNFIEMVDQYVKNRDSNKRPWLDMAESYAFYASRILLNKGELDPNSTVNPVRLIKKSILPDIRTGRYSPEILLWSITPKIAS